MKWIWIYLQIIWIVCFTEAIDTPDLQSLYETGTEYLSYVGITERKCSYVKNFPNHVNKILRRNIVAQDEALDAIIRALKFFSMQRDSGKYSPLVMAITGSTGTGKSETSKLIARGLYGLTSRDDDPCGLLMLSGKDYSFDQGMSRLQAQKVIKNQIIDHLIATGGEAIIIIDEIQSMIPGVLQVLGPALDESFPSLARQELEIVKSGNLFSTTTYAPLYNGKEEETCDNEGCYHKENTANRNSAGSSSGSTTTREVTRRYSTAKAIFVFISDIGVDAMTRLLMKAGDRKDMSVYELRNEIKKSLDKQWERLEMFTKSVNEVIPYLPLEPSHIQQIFHVKILQYSKQYQFKKWLSIHIEEDVILELTSSQYISYNLTTSIIKDTTTVTNSQENNGLSGKKITKRFARYGARSLEKGGPLQDLQSQLFSFEEGNKILHIGMITSEIADLAKLHWEIHEEDQIYMQWCSPDPTMLECTRTRCEKINFTQYMNHKGQISMYLWNKIVQDEENNGYRLKISPQHIFNPAFCEKGQVWEM